MPRFEPSLAVIPEEQPNDLILRWKDLVVELLLWDKENWEAMYGDQSGGCSSSTNLKD